jgi:hypothetical protein
MRVVLTGESTITTEVPLTPAERPLLERAWIGAQIERLADQHSKWKPAPSVDDPTGRSATNPRDAMKAEIIALSTKYRVLSDFTALLVLETEWDYQRFNIDRNALSDWSAPAAAVVAPARAPSASATPA